MLRTASVCLLESLMLARFIRCPLAIGLRAVVSSACPLCAACSHTVCSKAKHITFLSVSFQQIPCCAQEGWGFTLGCNQMSVTAQEAERWMRGVGISRKKTLFFCMCRCTNSTSPTFSGRSVIRVSFQEVLTFASFTSPAEEKFRPVSSKWHEEEIQSWRAISS